MELIVVVLIRGRLEWCGHVKRQYEAESITAVVEMKMNEKRTAGRSWDGRTL